MKHYPDGARGVAVGDDGAEDLLGDGLEKPTDDGRVDGQPIGVVRHGEKVDGAVDMIKEIILAEEKAEVRLPREEVCSGVRERHRHALENGDVADDGDGWAGEGVAAPGDGVAEGVPGVRRVEVGHGGVGAEAVVLGGGSGEIGRAHV